MNQVIEKYAFVFGMTFEIHRNGRSPTIGSTAKRSIRSRGETTINSTMFGFRSIISSKMATSPRFYR